MPHPPYIPEDLLLALETQYVRPDGAWLAKASLEDIRSAAGRLQVVENLRARFEAQKDSDPLD